MPQQHLPGATTRCTVWNGNTTVKGWHDDQEFRGDLLQQLKSALGFLKKNLRSSRIIEKEGGAYRAMCEIPFTVLEEAVLNALVHREYAGSIGTEAVKIGVFDDQ